MAKKVKRDDPAQSKRFIKKAKDLGCDTKSFDQVFEKVTRPKKS